MVDGISRRSLNSPISTAGLAAAVSPPPTIMQPQPATSSMAIDGIRRVFATRPGSTSSVDAAAPLPAALPLFEVTPTRPLRRPLSSYLLAGGLGVVTLSVGAYVYSIRAQAVQPVGTVAQPAVAAPATTASAPVTSSSAAVQSRLQAGINQIAAGFGAPVSISVYDLVSGASSTVNADTQMISASLYKLFVAESVYRYIDSGKLTYGSSVPGTGKNVADCLNAMITVSDNTCGEALGKLVGWQSQNNALHTSGYTHTSLQARSDEITSAGDVALLLKRLHEGSALSPNSTQNFINLLKAQRINNRLPVGLPAGTVVAHKTGDLDGLVHDAGIVYGPKGTYVISIMSGPWSAVGNAPAAFASASQQIYQILQQ